MGGVVFTGDARYGVQHPRGSNDWTLTVDEAREDDSGVYECQINTEPKKSKAYQLRVVGKLTVKHTLQPWAVSHSSVISHTVDWA